jgi:hypothetical protein
VAVALDYDRIFGALGEAARREIVRQAIRGGEGVAEEEGRRQAVGQIDAILADEPAGAGRGRR